MPIENAKIKSFSFFTIMIEANLSLFIHIFIFDLYILKSLKICVELMSIVLSQNILLQSMNIIVNVCFLGSREESEVVGFVVFSHIQMMGYFRLGQVRVNEFPAVLEIPAVVRHRGKAADKILRKPPLQILHLIHFFYILLV